MPAARNAGGLRARHGRPVAAAGGAGRGLSGGRSGTRRLRVPFAPFAGHARRPRPQPDRSLHRQGPGEPEPRGAHERALKGVELRGAVVAITGASAGIGWASALAFARAGSRLALSARRYDRLEALAAEVHALGSEALVMAIDVADAADVQHFVAATVKRFGRLDVMVNNAGSGVRGRVEETPVDDYRRLMEVNYLGTVHGCQAALP